MHTTTYEYPVYRGAHRLERLATIPVVALRWYLAWVWLRFAIMKFETGWLTTNPLRPLLQTVAAGQIPTTMPGYELVARVLVATHADAVLSVLIPCAELGVGLALVIGVAPRITALIATGLNVNLLLAGIGTLALDGKMIVLQIILIAIVTLFAPTSLVESLRVLQRNG
jgi:uncharacterized membrane protein YphA (DoxX/SURF4 family)